MVFSSPAATHYICFSRCLRITIRGCAKPLFLGTHDMLSSVEYMTNLCDREIVRVSPIVILAKPVGFHTTPELNAGLSYWITEAEKQGVSFLGFGENARPNPVCDLDIPEEDTVDELVPLEPANFALPLLVLVCCAVLASTIFLANRCAAKQRSERGKSLKKASSLFKLRVARSSKQLNGQGRAAPRFSMQPPQQQLEGGEFDADGVLEAMTFLEGQMNMWRTELREVGVVPNDHPQTTGHQEVFAVEN